MAKLLIHKVGTGPISYELIDGTTSIGRHPDNAIILHDASVSSHHAEIIGADGCFTLRDLQSSNGTTVNRLPASTVIIRDGDVISFGAVECRLENHLFEASSSRPLIPLELTPLKKPRTALPPPLPKGKLCKRIKNARNQVIGLWVGDIYSDSPEFIVAEFNSTEGIPPNLFEAFKNGKYRTVKNHYNREGGVFLMFDGALAPGEGNTALPALRQTAPYSVLLSRVGGYLGCVLVLSFPQVGGLIGMAIIGAVCAGGCAALGGAIGLFCDSVAEQPPITDKLPNRTAVAVGSLVLGILGLVAWILPIAGLPITITGLLIGMNARFSSRRSLALTGMGLSLLGLLLSSGNAYWGAFMRVEPAIRQLKQ